MKKILYSSLLLSILQSILFWHKIPGISVVIFISIAMSTIIYNLKEKQRINNKKGILWVIPIILLGLTYFIFNNFLFQLLNIPVILVLTIIMCIDITEGRLLENKFIKNICSKIFKPFSISSKSLKKLDIKGFIEKKKENQNKKIEFIKKLAKSLLISIPVILIIILLLSSADSVFGNLFNSIPNLTSKILKSKVIIDALWRITWIVITFLYFFGFILIYTSKEDKKQTNIQISTKISTFTINTLLITLNIIYLIFSIIQFKYLFINAGKTADFDYATYARTGFFQLMFVSFINFILLKMSKNIHDDKLNKILKILLVIFTMIIIISAVFRMYIYEQEYGYTYSRLFVYFILGTESLILIPILINICGKKLDTFKISLEIAVIMYVVLNFINIDYIIAKNNIDRYLNNPKNNSLDVYYIIRHTGTDAIEEKLRLLDINIGGLSTTEMDYTNYIKDKVKYNLKKYKDEYENRKFKWQEWNLSKYRTYKLLKNI